MHGLASPVHNPNTPLEIAGPLRSVCNVQVLSLSGADHATLIHFFANFVLSRFRVQHNSKFPLVRWLRVRVSTVLRNLFFT